MADTIGEQISQLVKTRLDGVTTGGGYNNTLTVTRATSADLKDGPKYTNNRAVIIEGDEDITEGTQAQTTEERTKPYQVDLYKVIATNDSTPVDQALNNVAGDVERAIVSDRFWNDGNDDLAMNTFLDGSERFEPVDGSAFGIRVFFRIQYRTSETTPFSLP